MPIGIILQSFQNNTNNIESKLNYNQSYSNLIKRILSSDSLIYARETCTLKTWEFGRRYSEEK